MAGADERLTRPPGLGTAIGYVYAGGIWRPIAGADQGDGTAAMLVSGAGIAPSATSLLIANGNGTTQATVAAGAVSVAVQNTVAVTGPQTDAQARATPQPVSGTVAVSGTVSVTPPHLSSATDSVTVTGTVTTGDIRGLTERMFAKAPQSGWSIWLDTADATYIYLAEAVSTETAGTAATFQGIRVQKDAAGNPLGKVQTATAFAWTARGTAGWS